MTVTLDAVLVIAAILTAVTLPGAYLAGIRHGQHRHIHWYTPVSVQWDIEHAGHSSSSYCRCSHAKWDHDLNGICHERDYYKVKCKCTQFVSTLDTEYTTILWRCSCSADRRDRYEGHLEPKTLLTAEQYTALLTNQDLADRSAIEAGVEELKNIG